VESGSRPADLLTLSDNPEQEEPRISGGSVPGRGSGDLDSTSIYLLDALSAIESDKVHIGLTDSNSSCLIHAPVRPHALRRDAYAAIARAIADLRGVSWRGRWALVGGVCRSPDSVQLGEGRSTWNPGKTYAQGQSAALGLWASSGHKPCEVVEKISQAAAFSQAASTRHVGAATTGPRTTNP